MERQMHWKLLRQTDKPHSLSLLKHLHLFFIFLISILLLQAGHCYANDANKNLIYKLWEINATDKLLNDVRLTLLEGEKSLVAGLEKGQADDIRKIVKQNFNSLKPLMIAYMAKNGRTSNFTKAYNWLVTPLGKKISKMELASKSIFSDPEAGVPKKMPEFSKERTALLTKFENLIYAPASSFLFTTMEHFTYLHNHTKPPNKRLSEKNLDQSIKLINVKIGTITTQLLPHIFKKSYGKLSLEEVTVYLNFQASTAGTSYTNLFIDAYIHALKKSRDKALLSLSKLFEDELSILSPYSKKKITSKKARELMAMLIKRHGKQTIIRAMLDARNGQMTIIFNGDEREVTGRPNHKYVTMDTLMMDLDKSGKNIRKFYLIVQEKLRYAN